MKPAIFLDRDGVLLENRPDYVRSWNDAHLLPGSLEALALAHRNSHRFVIVTNQSAVGRGLLTLEQAEAINRRLVVEVYKAGGRIDGVFMCIHAPDQGCGCRKPKPGLLLSAAGQLGLDLPRSILIGDAPTDLEAGTAAGVGRVALVRTGLGTQHGRNAAENGTEVYDDLAEALDKLLSDQQAGKPPTPNRQSEENRDGR